MKTPRAEKRLKSPKTFDSASISVFYSPGLRRGSFSLRRNPVCGRGWSSVDLLAHISRARRRCGEKNHEWRPKLDLEGPSTVSAAFARSEAHGREPGEVAPSPPLRDSSPAARLSPAVGRALLVSSFLTSTFQSHSCGRAQGRALKLGAGTRRGAWTPGCDRAAEER